MWKYYLWTLAWCRSTPYIESFLAFSRKFTSASAGLIPLQQKYNTWLIEQIRKTASTILLIAFNTINVIFSMTCSYSEAPSPSLPAHVSDWGQSGSHQHSLGHVPRTHSPQVQPGRCRSPKGHGWQTSRVDDQTGCHPSAAGTGSTWQNTETLLSRICKSHLSTLSDNI